MATTDYWDGLRLREDTDVPNPGEKLFFVHDGDISLGPVTALVREGDPKRLKRIIIADIYSRRPWEVAQTFDQIKLKAIVADIFIRAG